MRVKLFRYSKAREGEIKKAEFGGIRPLARISSWKGMAALFFILKRNWQMNKFKRHPELSKYWIVT